MNKNIKKNLDKTFTYPSTNDKDFLNKIYNKREFYYNKIDERPELDDYIKVKGLRDNKCGNKRKGIFSHQALLSNFINPNTPYKGLLLFHGTGTGKTCAAITIAENFKELVMKYNTKIYVLTPGPLIKESWKDQLINVCTQDTYIKERNLNNLSEEAQNRIKKNALTQAMQYYKFLSYRSFYRKVLGEKIKEGTVNENNRTKVVYRMTEEGEYERDISIDRIYNLDNSLIICDEAHHLTGNYYGEALLKIIKKSKNLKVILLTATPMKNLADDIVELLNFVRPINSPIVRDKIFNKDKNYLMEFKSGGEEYLKSMSRGYISYLRGADPVTMAKRIDLGEIPKGLEFTNVIRCEMSDFQKDLYNIVIQETDDALDRRSEAVANFAFPGLNDKRKNIIGLYGREGVNRLINQIKTDGSILNKLLQKFIKNKKYNNSNDLIKLSKSGKNISGKILHIDNLGLFSTKFHKALVNIKKLFKNGNDKSRTGFIYSNLVKVGIELFTEILLQNGFLEYQDDYNSYIINDNTIDYYYGIPYIEYIKKYKDNKFYPATFIAITGKATEDIADLQQEEKLRIVINRFNNIKNKDGKEIKLVLGSRVMNEGISLKNIKDIHILDVYFNLNRVDQVIGRGIRHCSHYNITNNDNKFPFVQVRKYVVKTQKGLSSEEDLYRKAEQKFLLIKKVERSLKEVAIDCPLNRNANVFKEEIKKYKGCEKKKNACPALCDYLSCNYLCDDLILNKNFYDPKRNIYKKIDMKKLDHSTFDYILSKSEKKNATNIIKKLYKKKYVYTLNNILDTVRHSYKGEKKDLFDPFFVYLSLNDMIPITENDFNNYENVIYDKFNRKGYLIYINKYYIFQPFNQNEDVEMYYRKTYDKKIENKISLYNYIKQIGDIGDIKENIVVQDKNQNNKRKGTYYDFDSVNEYYFNRKEFKYVGIIDTESIKSKNINIDNIEDVFKIREKRSKILNKKRGTGIQSLKGAVCSTSKSREYLELIAKKIGVEYKTIKTRINLCNNIKNKLLLLEKYSTGDLKMTYMMIPSNHKEYKFPYNLEDRYKYIIKKIKGIVNGSIREEVTKEKIKEGEFKGKIKEIKLKIKNNNNISIKKKELLKLGFKLNGNNWIIIID
jgi:superfamily II DNA or RNA helicase